MKDGYKLSQIHAKVDQTAIIKTAMNGLHGTPWIMDTMSPIVLKTITYLAAAAFLLLSLEPASAQAGLFGRQAKIYNNLKPFPKWTDALDRYLQEKGKTSGNCASKKFNRCHYKEWMAFIDSVSKDSKKKQYKKVNTFFNKRKYIVDPINWGISDYWVTPGQFFDKNGDCEDYAIAKYLTLRKLGWPTDAMRIVIVQDQNLKVAHAILAITYKKKNYILDNQIAIVTKDKRIKHYRPVYAVNETNWWRFH